MAFATSASYLVTTYAPSAFHEGIIEIKAIQSGLIIRDHLSFPTLVIKSIGLPLAIASGLVLGSEGPLVHVACCIGDLLLSPFPVLRLNGAKRREIMTSAVSAGISVAFGAPLGGTLFALEEISTSPGATLWPSFVSIAYSLSPRLYTPASDSSFLTLSDHNSHS